MCISELTREKTVRLRYLCFPAPGLNLYLTVPVLNLYLPIPALNFCLPVLCFTVKACYSYSVYLYKFSLFLFDLLLKYKVGNK